MVSANDDSEFRGDSDKDMSDSDEEDETLQKLAEKNTHRSSCEKSSKSTPQPVSVPVASNWIHGSWLMTKTLAELEKMKSPQELYMKVMKPSMDVLNERVSRMKCGVHNVETPPYPEDEEVQGFHDMLKEYEPVYDPTLIESEGLKKMPCICNFIEDEW